MDGSVSTTSDSRALHTIIERDIGKKGHTPYRQTVGVEWRTHKRVVDIQDYDHVCQDLTDVQQTPGKHTSR